MAVRTDSDSVEEIVDLKTGHSLAPHINAASSIVDHIESNDSDSDLSSSDLTIIETWLAAHFYSVYFQRLHSRKLGSASSNYQGKTDMYLESTTYGQQAIVLDVTGYLAKLNKDSKEGAKRTPSLLWGGKETFSV